MDCTVKYDNVTELMMHEALNSVNDGIVIVDKTSRILYVNDAYAKILAVSKDKVLYKQVKTIEPGALILKVLKNGTPIFHQLVEVKTRGKKIRVSITPIIKKKQLIGAVSIFNDITELTRSQEELEKAQRLNRSIFKAAVHSPHDLPAAFSDVIGHSPKFLRCLRLAEVVAPTDATVLIEGESGAGKEVLVNAILKVSGKRAHPYINLNCSAIPESLMESELFGYTTGSFTGAVRGGKLGKFELADGGTIFLDEIGEMPLFMQAKLLRVLQSGEIQKIGSNTVQKVNVRVIAATNRDLKQMVREGKFRDDLYFRLNTFKIIIPPLRERGKDILLLANFFLQRYSSKYGKKITLSAEVEKYFLSFPWRGNVRQLQSCMEYAVIVCNESVIRLEHLPEELQHMTDNLEYKPVSMETGKVLNSHSLKSGIQMIEMKKIQQAMEEAKGNKTKAMKILGISRRTFYKKWKAYGFDKK